MGVMLEYTASKWYNSQIDREVEVGVEGEREERGAVVCVSVKGN